MSAIQIATTDFIGLSQLLIAQFAAEDGGQFQLDELWGYGIPVALGVAFLIAVALVMAFIKYGKLWMQAFMSGANVSMLSLVGMEFRKVRPTVIVTAKIMAKQAGLDVSRRTGITTDTLEAHYLAGGDVMRVINAIIAAQRANIDLDFDRAAAIDLAGRDAVSYTHLTLPTIYSV